MPRTPCPTSTAQPRAPRPSRRPGFFTESSPEPRNTTLNNTRWCVNKQQCTSTAVKFAPCCQENPPTLLGAMECETFPVQPSHWGPKHIRGRPPPKYLLEASCTSPGCLQWPLGCLRGPPVLLRVLGFGGMDGALLSPPRPLVPTGFPNMADFANSYAEQTKRSSSLA